MPVVEKCESLSGIDRAFICFRLDEENCALPIERVREILPMARLLRPPGLPPLLEGFLNLDGIAVPVIRLDRLFRRPAQSVEMYTPLILLRDSDYPVALMVTSVQDVVAVPTANFLPVRDVETLLGCAEAELNINGKFHHLLSPDRILLEQESARVDEFQRMTQERLSEL